MSCSRLYFHPIYRRTFETGETIEIIKAAQLRSVVSQNFCRFIIFNLIRMSVSVSEIAPQHQPVAADASKDNRFSDFCTLCDLFIQKCDD